MLTKVTSVKYLKEYQLELTFEDGIQKIVDLEKEIILLKDPLTEPLKDIEYFKQVKLNRELGTIEWNNGYSCNSQALYENGTTIEEEIDPELLELVGIIKNEKIDDLKEYLEINKRADYERISKSKTKI